jgi:hypothetical protein
MFAGRFRTIKEYFEHVRGLVINSHLVANWHEIAFHPNNRTAGFVRCNQPLVFEDEATLRFIEDIAIDTYSWQIERAHYSYHYEQNSGYYFRYERDQSRARKADGTLDVAHPELHIHVSNEAPRYMTHKTSFEEVFKFIQACFYT